MTNENNIWKYYIDLDEGTYEYKFIINVIKSKRGLFYNNQLKSNRQNFEEDFLG